MRRIAVIGAGNWGTALSATLARLGHAVKLWAYEKEVAESIRARHENELFMPGVVLPESVRATNDLAEALDGAEIVLTVMPSHVCRSVFEQMFSSLRPETVFVSATEGLDTERLMRMSEVIRSVVGRRFPLRLTVLSGPSFAREVVRGDPTAVVVASEDHEAAELVQHEFSSKVLRLYTSTDVVGVELGGALKNPIAIAAGIGDGLGFGANAKAALITRGVVEMARLGVAMGGKPETFWGLSGLGDLVTTCLSGRNHWLGQQLGRGRSLERALASTPMVIEGVETARAAVALGRRYRVELPIIEQVHAILFERRAPRRALQALMRRSGKAESSSPRSTLLS